MKNLPNKKILLMGLIAPPFFIGLFLLILKLDAYTSKPTQKPTSEAFISACNESLTQTLTDIRDAATAVSNQTRDCYKNNDESCSKAHENAQALMETLDSNDLKLRWDYFSCSPLLYSKLRYMHKKAETIHLLTSLKEKIPALEQEASNVIDPNRFISTELENIKKDCCIRK